MSRQHFSPIVQSRASTWEGSLGVTHFLQIDEAEAQENLAIMRGIIGPRSPINKRGERSKLDKLRADLRQRRLNQLEKYVPARLAKVSHKNCNCSKCKLFAAPRKEKKYEQTVIEDNMLATQVIVRDRWYVCMIWKLSFTFICPFAGGKRGKHVYMLPRY